MTDKAPSPCRRLTGVGGQGGVDMRRQVCGHKAKQAHIDENCQQNATRPD